MYLIVCLISFLLIFNSSPLAKRNSTDPSELGEEFTTTENSTKEDISKRNITLKSDQEILSINLTTDEAASWSFQQEIKDEYTETSTKELMTDNGYNTETQTKASPSETTTSDVTSFPSINIASSTEKGGIYENSDKNFGKVIWHTNNTFQKVHETPLLSFAENVTSFEETVEHNAIRTTDFDSVTERGASIIVGHKCTKRFQDSILWNDTDGGMLALKNCPTGYQGNMYRPCFSSGMWGNVDYSECRLEHLGRMRHMIFHQVQKGMIGNMYVLADEFSKYISSVDMKSPMDRLEAFEILNTFLKLDMNLKMDKSRDTKYIQTLLHAANELIKRKTVLFSSGSQKNKLITEKAVEMIFDLTYFAERALRGLLKTQKKQIVFRAAPNVVLYLYRGKHIRQLSLMNFSSEYDRDDEMSSYFNLEKALERSAYALMWIKGLKNLLSIENLVVNSDVAVATILSPLNSLNRLLHPPTFDIGLQMKKEVPMGYDLKCGQLWNMSHLWNTKDCIKANVKGDIVTCRCHHLGSIALLLEEGPQNTSLHPEPAVGKMITVSCVTSLSAIIVTLAVNFLLKRRQQPLSIFILISLLICMATIQIILMFGVNRTENFEMCLSF
ncbi:hypothetical protein X975_10758, partial [Stegodyphus mimosarum]